MHIPGYYEYCNRVKVISGHNVLELIPGFLTQLGSSNPLLIADKGVTAVGLIKLASEAMGLKDITIYDDVPADSDLQTIKDIAKVYRYESCDSIIAIGGG